MIVGNVADLASYHSKMSDDPSNIDAISSSVDEQSNLSTLAKKQKNQKPVIKKVNFFCLKPENEVKIEDLDSQGMEDFDDFEIDELNKSIQKQSPPVKLKRNAKSFNCYSYEIYNDMDGLAN